MLCVLILIERGELDEWAVWLDCCPLVETDDQPVNGKEEVVVRLLQSLGDSVKLALVAAGVIGLRLARHRAYEVRVDTHGEAHHIDGFNNVRRPVATLLVRLDLVDHHVMLLLTIGRNIERREEYLSAVLHASEEVDDVVLLLVDTLLLLDTVSNALDFEDVVPKRVGNFDVVLYGSRVSELRFLSDADELLDVEPFAFEKSCVVRYWIIRIVGCRNTADDSELLDFLPSVLKVGEWRLWIEKFDALNVLRTDRITPVGIEDVRYHA